MKTLSLLTLLLLSTTPALAAPEKLDLACDIPHFGIKLKLTAKLSESRPEDHVEQYALNGSVEYTDSRGADLEFTHMPVNGTFDDSRGVIRISFRPNIPLMFNTISNFSVIQYRDGYQNYNVSSEGTGGPNGGGGGRHCIIQL